MIKKRRYKTLVFALAVFIIILVAVINPEHAETVAKAFLMLLGATV